MIGKGFINQWMSCGSILNLGDGDLILGYGKRTWLKEPDAIEPSFYFPDYFLKTPYPWFKHEQVLKICENQLLEFLNLMPLKSSKTPIWNNSYEKFFNISFNELKISISNGDLAKAVPFIIENSNETMDSSRLINCLKKMLHYLQANQAYAYGFWDNRKGILGATPEILFECDNFNEGILATMALAGTKKVEEDHLILMNNSKEMHEHDLVVKGIQQSLNSYGEVNLEDIKLLKLSNLMHLITHITLRLKGRSSFKEIVAALHPTPAVGAFPKKEGLKWLKDYECKLSRYRYGAPAGYLIPGEKSRCYVAIRNVQWKNQQLYLAAGCGVVADSQYASEWAEIQLKLKAIKEMLGL